MFPSGADPAARYFTVVTYSIAYSSMMYEVGEAPKPYIPLKCSSRNDPA